MINHSMTLYFVSYTIFLKKFQSLKKFKVCPRSPVWTAIPFCYIIVTVQPSGRRKVKNKSYWYKGEINMALLQQWRDKAYDEKANKGDLQRLWADYFRKEKDIYAQLLKTPDEVVTGTVRELAEKYQVDLMTMTGFLDGINDSLKEANPIEEMDEDTNVNLGFDLELLYKNMVGAGADWLYGLEEWNAIFDEDKRKALYKEQKSSTTIVKDAKIYPNDPCPCGSGKKYKKCCGRNV